MTHIVGVRFKPGGKTFLYTCDGFELVLRQAVVVDTQAGEEIAMVARLPRPASHGDQLDSMRQVLRLPTSDDLDRQHRNMARERDALSICAKSIQSHDLPMKLIDAQFTLDGSLVTINFAAENRVDFRELVRDVASKLHARIIFHQVGVRDRARALGTYAHCGQPLCCARFLTTLDPISMRMAKDQSLSINPAKFSGVCGKLMCCLRFEHVAYQDGPEKQMEPGDIVQTDDGPAEVLASDAGGMTVRLESGKTIRIAVTQPDCRSCAGCEPEKSRAEH